MQERFPKGQGGDEFEPVIGIMPEYITAWQQVNITALDPGVLDYDSTFLAPVRTYEEYVREKKSPENANRVLADSDPNIVSAVDQLVHQFNKDRERIIVDKDWAKLKDYSARAENLIRGNHEEKLKYDQFYRESQDSEK